MSKSVHTACQKMGMIRIISYESYDQKTIPVDDYIYQMAGKRVTPNQMKVVSNQLCHSDS